MTVRRVIKGITLKLSPLGYDDEHGLKFEVKVGENGSITESFKGAIATAKNAGKAVKITGLPSGIAMIIDGKNRLDFVEETYEKFRSHKTAKRAVPVLV